MKERSQYMLHENGECIGAFYACEIIKMLGITNGAFYSHVSNGTACGWYTFEEAEEAVYNEMEIKTMKEWDRVRFVINPEAKEGAVYE